MQKGCKHQSYFGKVCHMGHWPGAERIDVDDCFTTNKMQDGTAWVSPVLQFHRTGLSNIQNISMLDKFVANEGLGENRAQ